MLHHRNFLVFMVQFFRVGVEVAPAKGAVCKTDPIHGTAFEVDIEYLLALLLFHIEIIKDHILQFQVTEVKVFQINSRKVVVL